MANPVITFENCKILYPNFSGRESELNDEGNRNFNIEITEETIAHEDNGPIFKGIDAILGYLRNIVVYDKDGNKYEQGANVKMKVNDDGDATYSLKVNFGKYEPRHMYYVIEGKGKKQLNISTVGQLDGMHIEKAIVTTSFSPYNRKGNKGVTSYISDIIAYIKEDRFMQYLNDIPDLEPSTIASNGINFESVVNAEPIMDDNVPFD